MNKDIKQLEIQNFIFLVFSIISLLNIKGDKYLEEYLLDKNNYYKIKSNKIFKFTIKITIIIYIYFLIRNIDAYNNISNDKKRFIFNKSIWKYIIISRFYLSFIFSRTRNFIYRGTCSIDMI